MRRLELVISVSNQNSVCVCVRERERERERERGKGAFQNAAIWEDSFCCYSNLNFGEISSLPLSYENLEHFRTILDT